MPRSRLRVLLSEGSSSSARQAVTALGLAGHHVEICDPDSHCIARFSRFVRRFHRCPGIGRDPEGYVAFVLDLVARERFDVLLPIHEQGLALAKVRTRLAAHVAVALPSFESYRRAHSKAGFVRVIAELGLPQPATRFAANRSDAMGTQPPAVLKASIGTASRGVWIVDDAAQLRRALDELEEMRAFQDEVLVQDKIGGHLERAQGVFQDGRLCALHAYRQVLGGAGGGDAIKESVDAPDVRAHLERLGRHLDWQGALSVDYIRTFNDSTPCYIDCNPRLVEPMNGVMSGNDLVNALLRLSLGEPLPTLPAGRAGTRTHNAIQAMLHCAMATRSRPQLLRECRQLAAGSGPYAGSTEEFTPITRDWLSIVPLGVAAAWLLANPNGAEAMVRRGWGSHLLTGDSVRRIASLPSE